jgi:hypothetical protein
MASKKEKLDGKGQLPRLTITVEADEATMQRLTTLMMFAHVLTKEELAAKERKKNRPAEEFDIFATEPSEPELTVVTDPETARLEITKALEAYIGRHGFEFGRRLLLEYGAERVSQLAEDKLGPVLADLLGSMPWYGKGTSVK